MLALRLPNSELADGRAKGRGMRSRGWRECGEGRCVGEKGAKKARS